MTLNVYVTGRPVATLEAQGDFRSVMRYHDHLAPCDFVSLTMPVRREPWIWDDVLHPIFQMNLPEGFLLQALQEKFGPHITGHPLALLAVIGRRMIGRIQVAPPGALLNEPASPVDVAALLQGDNSEEAFAQLVRQHATSGVSGVVPKFLDEAEETFELANHNKVTVLTHRHIIKGASRHLPFVTLNEHLCMAVARQVMPAAVTEISRDGQALLVHRFDVDERGELLWGMEDFCALLGLRPAAKYDTTWERIAKAVRNHVTSQNRMEAHRQLATLLLLTYALRNADCHSKNIALRYSRRDDVHLAPAYDMITTAAYPDYAANPPGIGFLGRKTWTPGKTLERFITTTFGINGREQRDIVDQIGAAMVQVGPQVREAMDEHRGFRNIGKRMLQVWSEGLTGLHEPKVYALMAPALPDTFSDFSDPEPSKPSRTVVGRSELMGRR